MHCSIFKIPFSLSRPFTRKFSFPRSLWQLVYYITSSRTCQVNNLWTGLFSLRFLNGQLIYYIISNKLCQVNKLWTRTAFRSLPHLLYSLAIPVRQLYYYSMILPDCQAKLSLSFHLIYIIFVQWYSEVLPFIGRVLLLLREILLSILVFPLLMPSRLLLLLVQPHSYRPQDSPAQCAVFSCYVSQISPAFFSSCGKQTSYLKITLS